MTLRGRVAGLTTAAGVVFSVTVTVGTSTSPSCCTPAAAADTANVGAWLRAELSVTMGSPAAPEGTAMPA